jgi:hypothetical protein
LLPSLALNQQQADAFLTALKKSIAELQENKSI